MSSQLNKSAPNKKLNYALLALVFTLWGGVMYKYFFKSTNEIETNLDSLVETPQTTALVIKKETYDLLLNYPDPFAIKKIKKTQKKKAFSIQKTIKPVVRKKYVPWPILNYYGMAKNKQSNKKVAILSINGQSVLLSEKRTKHNVTMNDIYNDSVVVVFEGEKKTVAKETK
jgi:hypothetical protein